MVLTKNFYLHTIFVPTGDIGRKDFYVADKMQPGPFVAQNLNSWRK